MKSRPVVVAIRRCRGPLKCYINLFAAMYAGMFKSTSGLSIMQDKQVCMYPYLRRCVRLGDSAYEALATHCPAIRELRLYASMPSAKALQGLIALRQLQVIDLCGAHAVTGTFPPPCTVLDPLLLSGYSCGLKGRHLPMG